jgi:hypothetical protein
MILATHALVGAALGKNLENPWLIVVLCLITHFALDSFRHGEYVESFDSKTTFKNTWWKTALDLFFGSLIIGFFIYYQNIDRSKIVNILLGSFSSMFPDLLTFFYWKFKFKFLAPIYAFHTWSHKYPRFSSERQWNLRNAANDILFSLLAILFLIF